MFLLNIAFVWFGSSFLAATAIPVSEKKMYYGYQVLQAIPYTEQHVETLNTLHEKHPEIDFWTPIKVNHGVDIAVSPTDLEGVIVIFKMSKISYKVLIQDLQRSMDEEQASMATAHQETMMAPSWWCRFWGIGCETTGTGGSGSGGGNTEVVGMFARHKDINNWLEKMSKEFQSLMKVENIGKSHEGREMLMAKIGNNLNAMHSSKPIIFIEAGIHAREWIAPAVAVYIIDMMLKGYRSDPEITELINKFDWFVLPSANPDGYEYTHTGDRLWRKTRSRVSNRCSGVDPNRNFDVDFGVSGVSSNPCSSVFPGKTPFSEPETANIRDKINEIKSRVRAYLSFHSYSQMLLTPFGYTKTRAPDHNEMMRVGRNSMDALKKVHGTIFQVGPPPELLYAASGSSADWAKVEAKIKYAFTYELRPKGDSGRGFILNRSEIKPSAEEVMASLVSIAKDIVV